MPEQDRDEQGRFAETMRDHDILLVFDYETPDDDPYLTVGDVTAGLATHCDIDVTTEAVRHRLDRLVEAGQIAKRQFGPGVAYRALVAPQLAPDVEAESDRRRATPREEFVSLTDG